MTKRIPSPRRIIRQAKRVVPGARSPQTKGLSPLTRLEWRMPENRMLKKAKEGWMNQAKGTPSLKIWLVTLPMIADTATKKYTIRVALRVRENREAIKNEKVAWAWAQRMRTTIRMPGLVRRTSWELMATQARQKNRERTNCMTINSR